MSTFTQKLSGVLVFAGVTALALSSSHVPGGSKTTSGSPATAQRAEDANNARVQAAYGNLPLSFIQNNGQVDQTVMFYEQGPGHATSFTEGGVSLSLSGPAAKTAEVTLVPVGGNPHPVIVAEGLQEGKINYFVGNDPTQWKTGVPTYQAVRYQEIYPGIDMKFYGNNRQLEYDVIVKPGADPAIVEFAYEGIEGLRVTEAGDLEIRLTDGAITQKKPIVYQQIDGKRVDVEGAFTVHADASAATPRGAYSFQVVSYDRAHDLIIDPVLIYSTYLGGIGNDQGRGIAIDSSGNAYVSGIRAGDAFVTKLNGAGTAILYHTVFGGTANDGGHGIVIDSGNNAYVTGFTQSINFPFTPGVAQPATGGGDDAFVAKLDSAGAVAYATYLGGSGDEAGNGIAVDSAGNAYVTGQTDSTDFPTASPLQGANAGGVDGFVTALDAAGAVLTYSTYLGATLADSGQGIAADSAGNAYVTGSTAGTGFPITLGVVQPASGGGTDAFVTALDAAGLAVYSTYLGGSGSDEGHGVALDSSGNAYVAGQTGSADFPTASPIQGASGGGTDAFVSKLDAAGTALTYSTYLGGSGADIGNGIDVDNPGNAYVIGQTSSTNFPLVGSLQGTYGGGANDVFVTMVDFAGAALPYSTYMGGTGNDLGRGIAADTAGAAFVTGQTNSTAFPTLNPVQGSLAGGTDAFAAKLSGSLLINISTRSFVGTGFNVSVAGFIIDGTGDKQVLIRGFGPTLADFGVVGPLGNPTLDLEWDDDNNPGTPAILVLTNDDWGTALGSCPAPAVVCGTPADILATGMSADSYAPSNPNRHLDAAFLLTLPPGTYTARLSGVSGGTGVGLIGLDDMQPNHTVRLVNISTRAFVGTGANVEVGGFIISGTGTKQILIRGFGPTLADFGVGGPLGNPTMDLEWDHDNNPLTAAILVLTNDNWGTALGSCPAPAVACGTPADILATGMSADSYAPSNPNRGLDAALLLTMPPGTYTVRLSGVSGGTGVGLIGVDEVAP